MQNKSSKGQTGKRWVFNEFEHEAFQQLIWDGYPFASLIYMMELRPHMDAATRIVGDKRKVSEAGIGEMLERHAKAGSHNGSAKKRDRYYIQRQLKALEDYGLLVRLPKARRNAPMRLLLVLADAGSFRPQEERTMSALGKTHNKNTCAPTPENSATAGASLVRSAVDNSEGSHNEKVPRSAQHQESGTTSTIYVNTDCSTHEEMRRPTPGDGNVIPETWEPDDLLIREIQKEFRLPGGFLRERGVIFRMQAKEHGYIRKNWRESFRQWVRVGVERRYAEYQQYFNDG